MLNPELRSGFFKFLRTCDLCISNIRDPVIKEMAKKDYSKLNNTYFFLSKQYGNLFPCSKFPSSDKSNVLLHPYAIEDACYSLFFIILYESDDTDNSLNILENFVFYTLTRFSIIVSVPKVKTKFYSNQVLKINSFPINNKYKFKTNEASRFHVIN